MFGPLLLRGVVDLVLASTRSLAAAMGALVAYGVGTSTGMVTYNSLLQAKVAPRCGGGCSPALICCGRPADPAQQRIQPCLPAGGVYVYAVACGHRLIFGCVHNTGSSTVAALLYSPGPSLSSQVTIYGWSISCFD
jgi:hypothetical protein